MRKKLDQGALDGLSK